MPSEAQMRLKPLDLSYRVLQMIPQEATPNEAARAIRRYVMRKRSGLAQVLEVEATAKDVIVRARGEYPDDLLREATELLGVGRPPEPDVDIEVDAALFGIEVIEVPEEEPVYERELLRSRVRYFPHPVCEWFEISTGALALTGRRITFEPEWAAMPEDGEATRSGIHEIELADLEDVWQGDWWDVPCLMLRTPLRTYRYGWPGDRGDLEALFDVDEWIAALRPLLGESE